MFKQNIADGTDMETIMTVHEVARYLRLSAATIYKLAQARRIPATKIGRAWRFSKLLVDEWMREQATL